MTTTQVDRVLQALRHGPVAATDFSAPRVIDGGKPIFRVAARIQDLRDRGYEITTSRLPNGVASYELTENARRDSRPTAGEPSHPVASSTASAVAPGAPHGAAAPDSTRPRAVGSSLFDPDGYRPSTSHHLEEAA